MTVTINFYGNVKTSFGKDLYHLLLNSPAYYLHIRIKRVFKR